MKLWIIGKRGLLATALQRKCQEIGIDFIATSRKEVDLIDTQGVQAQCETLSFTHIVNCAGYTAVDQAEQEEEKAHALNATAIGFLAQCAHTHGKKLLHFSTDYVFDGEDKRYQEDAKTAPLSIYGKSKEAGEKMLFENHPQACLIRTSWLFGKEGNHFVQTMIRLMEQEETIRVVNDQWGRPTYADDLADAALSLLDAEGIYHFANQGETTWYGFAQAIQDLLEKEKFPLKCQQVEGITTAEFGALAPRPSSSILETKSFSPPHWEKRLQEVIRHVIAT